MQTSIGTAPGVFHPLRLRGGGGFAAVVPINRLLGKGQKNRGHNGDRTAASAPTERGRDAALLDALKNMQNDTHCQLRVAELLQDGASARVQDPSSACEFCAIHLAAARGLTDAVSALGEKGAAVDAPGKHGQTALSLAAARGHLHTVERLLSLGAAVSQRQIFYNVLHIVHFILYIYQGTKFSEFPGGQRHAGVDVPAPSSILCQPANRRAPPGGGG